MQARAGGYTVMALHTRTDIRPAASTSAAASRRPAKLTDPEFERLTGVRGNVVYVKRLD